MPVCVFMYMSHTYMWMSENNCRSQLSPSIMESRNQTQSSVLTPSTSVHWTISLAPCIGIILSINKKNNAMSQILQAILRLENICLAIEIWCWISHRLGMEVRTLPLTLTVGKGQTGTLPNAKVQWSLVWWPVVSSREAEAGLPWVWGRVYTWELHKRALKRQGLVARALIPAC